MGQVTGAPGWTGPTGIDAQFLEMMPDTINFAATSSKDKYGKKTFGSNTGIRGRIVDEIQLIKNDQGQDVVTKGRVYLYGDHDEITLGHSMTLPDGTSPVIIRVDNVSGISGEGIHHTVVHFGM